MTTLREKILNYAAPIILYELIPPGAESCNEEKEAYAACASEILLHSGVNIAGINIPEIHGEESKPIERTQVYEPKIDTREFADLLTKISPQNSFELIINRCTVHETLDAQSQWLDKTYHYYNIHNIVLVGGESSKITYPGPSVTEMGDYINSNYLKNIFCGGITIPSRRHEDDPQRDEAYRLLNKARHGLEFFTSQVLYDFKSIEKLLKDYDALCKKNGEFPKRIFLSFAPISTRKDLEFLRWLGVEIPSETEAELLKTNIGIGWRSIKISKLILKEIINFISSSDIQVPLGLNIEHITRRNFELSHILIEELGKCYIEAMQLFAKQHRFRAASSELGI